MEHIEKSYLKFNKVYHTPNNIQIQSKNSIPGAFSTIKFLSRVVVDAAIYWVLHR